MNKPLTLVAAAAFSSAAFGDVTLEFEDFAADGFEFASFGEISGTLTSIEADFTLTNDVIFSWANDLAILVENDEGTQLQVGGYSTVDFAAPKYLWGTGSSGTAGTSVLAVIPDLNIELSGDLQLGNGYVYGDEGVWTGSITLRGVDFVPVPAPGALALLGIAGMGRRRRS